MEKDSLADRSVENVIGDLCPKVIWMTRLMMIYLNLLFLLIPLYRCMYKFTCSFHVPFFLVSICLLLFLVILVILYPFHVYSMLGCFCAIDPSVFRGWNSYNNEIFLKGERLASNLENHNFLLEFLPLGDMFHFRCGNLTFHPLHTSTVRHKLSRDHAAFTFLGLYIWFVRRAREF